MCNLWNMKAFSLHPRFGFDLFYRFRPFAVIGFRRLVLEKTHIFLNFLYYPPEKFFGYQQMDTVYQAGIAAWHLHNADIEN